MKTIAKVFAVFMLLAAGALNAQQLTLDDAVKQAARGIEDNVPQRTLLAVLNFVSPSDAFSDYVIEELTGELVMGRKVSIVDRRSLALITQEMNLQLSGDVSDESAQAIGKMLGAQAIVSGSLTNLGTYHRFRIRVINVETAMIQTQVSLNLQNDAQVAFLLGIAQTPQATAPTPATTPQTTPAQPATPAASTPAPMPTPAPAATASGAQNRPGLYVNGAFQGAMDLLDAIDWIAINGRAGGNFTIVLGKNETAPYITLNTRANITLKSDGVAERTVRYEGTRPAYSLFTVGTGVTFTLEDGVALVGLSDTGKPLVTVAGGAFIMNGGSIRNNSADEGAGVFLESGAFTMNGGAISGNAAYLAGGVYVGKGTFTMNNGTISGNRVGGRRFGQISSNNNGGGVYVSHEAAFTMLGGTISGNTADDYGGGVYVNLAYGGTFTKSATGGVIYGSNAPDGQANKAGDGGAAVYAYTKQREATARASQAMDSRQYGAAGGWE